MKEYEDMFNPYFLSSLSPKKDVYTTLLSFPKDAATTMAYIPFQQDTSTYEASKALCQGTLFPDLDKPFCPPQRGRA